MIEALVISVGEPQLEKCLAAIANQVVPFDRVTHVKDVSPEFVAINRGIAKVQEEWFMKIDGDMILYPSAVEIALSCLIDKESDFIHAFCLFDDFLQSTIRGVGVIKTKVIQTIPFPNFLMNDSWVCRKLAKRGGTGYRHKDILGTHCEDPDEFQVFKRFYSTSIKHGSKYTRPLLDNLYAKTKNPLYDLAIKAVEFGIIKKHYPTSHDLNFDLEMFNEFKNFYKESLIAKSIS